MKTILQKYNVKFIFKDDTFAEYGVKAINKHDALQKGLCILNEHSLTLDEVDEIILRSCT